MIRKSQSVALFSLLAMITAFSTACSKNEPVAAPPIVADHKGGNTPSALDGVTIVLNKKAILDTDFLYGADLQYSSDYSASMDLFNQSMVLGLIPANFKVWGNELRLIAQNTRIFPSDVNHPDQIISRYRIISQNDTTITVTAANSGIYLSQLMQATDPYKSPDAPAPRDTWVRSFEFVGDKNMVLQETTVQAQDGTLFEVMESLIPRSSAAIGSDFQRFEVDPADPVGAESGVVARFRLLGAEKIFFAEQPISYAQHFDISKNSDGSGGTIDWWVTRNIPDDYLAPVQLAIEGWNRYFRNFKGINRDVLVFHGKLPEGAKLGDPRYNVIAWDNRSVAGAAYESQAADPFTGKQTHSLIYMPAAWLQIGEEFWTDGKYSEREESVSPDAKINNRSALKMNRLECIRDMNLASDAIAHEIIAGRLSKKDGIKEFGIELLKGVIFHEVGHALGLAHNFKGSLSFDLTKPDSDFSTSIMDYNDYQFEKKAFKSVDSSDGPLLAYDRQALSAIYNNSEDIKSDDPTLPACNDAEADAEAGGVDPLCIRYDMLNDPTLSVTTAFDRVTLDKMVDQREMTLPESIRNAPAVVLTADNLNQVTTDESLQELATHFVGAVKSSLKFYFLTSTGGVSRTVRTNIKSLLSFKKDVLPETGYDQKAMRERAFVGVQKALAMMSLPAAVTKSLTESQDAALKALTETPYLRGLDQAKKEKTIQALKASMSKQIQAFETSKTAGIPRIRTRVLDTLKRHDKVPFFLGKLGNAQLDFETAIIGLLSDATLAKDLRGSAERISAATSLASFKTRGAGKATVQAAIDKIELERAIAVDNDSRETAEKLLAVLGK